jgi:hypothetical protein
MVGDIEFVLGALNRAGVRYLVVGGVAVVLHGYLRTTADLDLVVQLQRENALRAIEALGALGYRPRAPVNPLEFADSSMRARWTKEKGLTVFSLWSPDHPALEVDLFVNEPFDFDEVYRRALRVPLERTEIIVIGLDDLIGLKRLAGRPMDQQDIDALEAVRSKPGDSAPEVKQDDAGA